MLRNCHIHRRVRHLSFSMAPNMTRRNRIFRPLLACATVIAVPPVLYFVDRYTSSMYMHLYLLHALAHRAYMPRFVTKAVIEDLVQHSETKPHAADRLIEAFCDNETLTNILLEDFGLICRICLVTPNGGDKVAECLKRRLNCGEITRSWSNNEIITVVESLTHPAASIRYLALCTLDSLTITEQDNMKEAVKEYVSHGGRESCALACNLFPLFPSDPAMLLKLLSNLLDSDEEFVNAVILPSEWIEGEVMSIVNAGIEDDDSVILSLTLHLIGKLAAQNDGERDKLLNMGVLTGISFLLQTTDVTFSNNKDGSNNIHASSSKYDISHLPPLLRREIAFALSSLSLSYPERRTNYPFQRQKRMEHIAVHDETIAFDDVSLFPNVTVTGQKLLNVENPHELSSDAVPWVDVLIKLSRDEDPSTAMSATKSIMNIVVRSTDGEEILQQWLVSLLLSISTLCSKEVSAGKAPIVVSKCGLLYCLLMYRD